MTAGFFMPAVLVAGFTNSLHLGPQAVLLGVGQAVELSAFVCDCGGCAGVVTSGDIADCYAAEVRRLVQWAAGVPEGGHTF